jgi:phosphatidylinositol alpha-mannosyltransferase
MKVGLVCPYDFSYPGGVSSHIANLAAELTRRDHSVKIIAPSSGRPSDSPNLIRLGRAFPVPTHGSVARVSFSVWRRAQVKATFEREQFDVIHIHEPLSPVLPLMALYFSKALTVGTFHAFHKSTKLYWASQPLLRGAIRKLHGRIAVSIPARDYVSRYFPGEYRLIPNGIDVDHFAKPAEPIEEFQDGKINILFVGRREKRKGLKYLLAAYSTLKWRCPDIRLIVVGQGHPDPECQRMIAERQIRDVVFTGPLTYNSLPQYYASADIFCSPATGAESFGIVLLEAMAAGKPIVASNIEGYASVLQDGKDGVLVPPKQDEALAQALETLVNEPETRARMGSHGQERSKAYRWEIVASRVLDYYEELLQRERETATP